MSPVRIVVLSVAAVAAIGLAMLFRNITPRAPAGPPCRRWPQKPMARVLVAARDLAVGTR